MNQQQKQANSKQHWLDNPGNIRKLYRSLWGVFILLVFADLLYPRHADFAIENWFGFYGIFGFLAYSFIVVAGWVWRKLVMRREDYYDR